MKLKKDLPDYYPTMYLDGYTPEEILQAKRKSMLKKGSIKDADVVLSKNQEKELEKQIQNAVDKILQNLKI